MANGYVYTFGGFDGSAYYTSVYYAKLNDDGSTGAWQTGTNTLPDVRGDYSTIFSNGYIYVIGGENGGGAVSSVYYAKVNTDGSTGVWYSSANVLPAPRGDATSIVSNGFVYVIGGTSDGGSTFVSTVYYAKLNTDGSTGAWQTNSYAIGCTTPGCGSPSTRSAHSSVIANGYVYVIGGYNGSGQSTVYYAKLNADGSTGAWSRGNWPAPS